MFLIRRASKDKEVISCRSLAAKWPMHAERVSKDANKHKSMLIVCFWMVLTDRAARSKQQNTDVPR